MLRKRSIQLNIIGPNIRSIREHLNLTQDELAARCNLLGWSISRGTLAKIESRVRKVSDIECAILAKALKAKPSDLFT